MLKQQFILWNQHVRDCIRAVRNRQTTPALWETKAWLRAIEQDRERDQEATP